MTNTRRFWAVWHGWIITFIVQFRKCMYWMCCVHDWGNVWHIWIAKTDQKLLSLSNMSQIPFWPLRALCKVCVLPRQSGRRSVGIFVRVCEVSIVHNSMFFSFKSVVFIFCYFDVSWATLNSNNSCSNFAQARWWWTHFGHASRVSHPDGGVVVVVVESANLIGCEDDTSASGVWNMMYSRTSVAKRIFYQNYTYSTWTSFGFPRNMFPKVSENNHISCSRCFQRVVFLFIEFVFGNRQGG